MPTKENGLKSRRASGIAAPYLAQSVAGSSSNATRQSHVRLALAEVVPASAPMVV